ncbi:protein ALP1-like [Argentina anserina]|uniref:protein ALP1-like n=1 Tax=Argentina anserina TaxID=57926 RepID=UPI0021762D31|nr:protein ALP1-like [Potentilla anserina]
MKIKPPPNPDPEHPDLSSIYSFLQSSLHHQMNNDTTKKRRRKTDGDGAPPGKQGKMKDLKGIITTLSLREQQEKQEEKVSNDDTSFLEEKQNYQTTKTKAAMLDYYSDMQGYYSEVEESETVKQKKSRNAAAASVAAAVDGGSSEKSVKPGGSGQHRRLWVKDRSKAWWDECNQPDFPEEEFKQAFRMGKATFDLICEELNSAIAKEDTTLRNAIPVRQRVAVCLWRLATGDPLRLVSKRFGLGISTCHKLVLEVCSAIRTVLMPKYLNWPGDGVLRKVKDEFEAISGIPNVVGSMYTTHIPIIAPKISVAAYFNKRHTERNQKTSYSITVQGVVNPKGVFTDVCIGWPGSMPDDQVLEKSALHQRAGNGLLKGVWIVGSSGYPLLDWVLVPYTQQHLTWTQHAFNEKIGEVQNVSKEAFARLKGRWLCLQKRTEVKLQDLPVVLGACCVLHNICELRNEEIDPELRFELVDDEMIPEVPLRSQSSLKARDAIAHNLLHHGLAGTSFL